MVRVAQIVLVIIALLLQSTFSQATTGKIPGNLSYSQLESMIKNAHVQSIEDLLQVLPEDFRRSYTLVYNSQSLQRQDVYPAFPRIILYSPDGKLVLAMTKGPNQGPSQIGEDKLETIEFDSQASQFIFREIHFTPGVDSLNPPPQKNPSTCLSCHGGSNPRPNWENYNFWPGVYGSISRDYCSTFQSGTLEWNYYNSYLASGAGKGRYSYLGTPLVPSYVCPNGSNGGQPRGSNSEKSFFNGVSTDPNSDLGSALAALNLKKIGATLKSSALFPKFQFLLAALGKSCAMTDFESYFPAGNPGLSVETYDQTLNEIVTLQKKDFANRLALFQTFNASSATDPLRAPVNFFDPAAENSADTQTVLALTVHLKMVADRMGLDTSAWAMSFVAPDDFGVNFAFPVGNGNGFINIFSKFSDEAALRSLSCEELQKKSVEALSR